VVPPPRLVFLFFDDVICCVVDEMRLLTAVVHQRLVLGLAGSLFVGAGFSPSIDVFAAGLWLGIGPIDASRRIVDNSVFLPLTSVLVLIDKAAVILSPVDWRRTRSALSKISLPTFFPPFAEFPSFAIPRTFF